MNTSFAEERSLFPTAANSMLGSETFRLDEKKFDAIHHFFDSRCMGRTNINLDDELVSKGLKATGLRTKSDLVDLALRELVRRKEQRKILSLKGKVSWVGDLDQSRTSRF